MNEIDRWEDEGGASHKQWSEMTRDQKSSYIYLTLSELYPALVYSEMDGAIFVKTLTPLDHGSIVTYEGCTFRVLYGWHWTTYGNIPVYMAELDIMKERNDKM